MLLKERQLRRILTLLIESALDDEASRISAREKDVRKEQWISAAEALRGVPSAKQVLGWLAKNVPLGEPVGDVLPMMLDWARMRDEKRLLPGETDLAALDRAGLERINKRANIGRDLDVRMPKAPIATARGGEKVWDIYLPMNIGESCAVARMASPGNDSYEIPWCTARDKNNMFYGYAANDVLLYYVVNRERPEEKYSLGFHDGKLIEPSDGGATVDWQNRKFDLKKAFGPAWDAIMHEIAVRMRDTSRHGLHPATIRIVEAASDPTAWRELIRRTSDDPGHEIGLYRALVMPSKNVVQELGDRIKNGMVQMHPQVAMNFLLTASRAGETDYSLMNYFKNALVKVLNGYWDHLQETSEGKRAEAEISRISKDSIGAPGGYHTPASFILKWIDERRTFESGKSRVLESLGSVGHWSSLENWIVQNARMITTGGRGPKVDFAPRIAERMTDSQLAVMIDPFEVFDGLDRRLPDYLTQSWDHEAWAGFLLPRLMKLNNPMVKRAQYLVRLVEPYGDYYRLPLRHMSRSAENLPKKQQERWENLERLTAEMWKRR